jgi:hypothetical protein
MEWFKSNEKKLQVALYYTVLFVIVSSPVTYSFTNYALSRFVNITVYGAPSVAGIILHAIVYFVLAALLAKKYT